EVFGAKRLGAIARNDVEKYRGIRAEKGKKPATINTDLTCLKAMLSYFVKIEVLTVSPAARVKCTSPNNEKMRVLSREEEQLYLAACPPLLHDVAALMLDLGMRPDEIYRMKRENVNLTDGYVFNPYGKTKAARRKLPLTRRAAD